MLGQELGMAAEPVAGSLDLDDDGMVEKPVEQSGGDDRVRECVMMPPSLIAWCVAAVS